MFLYMKAQKHACFHVFCASQMVNGSIAGLYYYYQVILLQRAIPTSCHCRPARSSRRVTRTQWTPTRSSTMSTILLPSVAQPTDQFTGEG